MSYHVTQPIWELISLQQFSVKTYNSHQRRLIEIQYIYSLLPDMLIFRFNSLYVEKVRAKNNNTKKMQNVIQIEMTQYRNADCTSSFMDIFIPIRVFSVSVN